MADNIEEMNIYQKLAKIRKQVEVIQKDTKGFNYKYVREDTILAKVTGLMDKYHLSLIPGIASGSTNVEPYAYKKTRTTNKGEIYEENVNEVLVWSDMVWTWVNNDNPDERIECGWSLVGQQADASQAFGSGLTYAGRYFLLKYFNIATPDNDPDAFRTQQKETIAAEDKGLAEQIIAELDGMIRDFLAEHDTQKEAVKEFCSKYVKSGDYFKVTESIVAAKMLADFKDTFLKKGKAA